MLYTRTREVAMPPLQTQASLFKTLSSSLRRIAGVWSGIIFFHAKRKQMGNGILENIVRLLSEWGCHEMNANQPPLVRLSL